MKKPRPPLRTLRLLPTMLALLALATPAAAEPLRVITYNLHGMSPGSNWQVRLFFIVQRLIELDPDLICLQEVCETLDGGGADNMARTIAEDLGGHFGREYEWYFQQTHIGWEQFGEGVAIVSRYPVTQSGFRQLATGTFPRKCVWNRVQAPTGEVQVFSTHLEHTASGGAVRLLQATQARDYVLENLAAFPGSVAVLGGDFNATPASAPIQLFTAAGPDSLFADAWAALHAGENGYTMPAESPASRIDYLFSRGPGQPWAPDSSRLEFTQPYDGTHFMSDHFGLYAVYDLQDTPLSPGAQRPQGTLLGVARPNPFNPETRIELALPAASDDLRLRVVDLLGRERAVLHQGPLGAGAHAFTWHPAGDAAGLYLIVLRSGVDCEVRQVLYLP